MKLSFYFIFLIFSFKSFADQEFCKFTDQFEQVPKTTGIFRTKSALFESFRECPHFQRKHLYTSEDLEKLLIFGSQAIKKYNVKKKDLEKKISTVGDLKLGSKILFKSAELVTSGYPFLNAVAENIGQVTDRIFETSMAKIVQKKEQQSRDILVGAIQYYVRKDNINLHEINSAILSDLANKIIMEVGKEEYPLANYALLNSLKQDSALILNEIKNTDQGQKMTLAELKTSLSRLDKTGELLLDYGEMQLNDLKKLDQRQGSIKDNIIVLKTLMQQDKASNKQNLKHIEFLQEFIFGTMSPDKQLEALKKGWLAGLSGKKREKTERELKIKRVQLQLLEDKKEFIKDMGDFAEGTQHIAQIMGFLNMKPELIKVANLGQQVAGSFANIATSLLRASTGAPLLGYLNVASSLLSLTGLFKKKRDIGLERHKQVMSALSDLQDGQFKIRKEQWKYYESLRNGVEGLNRQHAKTQKILMAMGSFLVETREEIVKSLEKIYEAVSLNRQLLWSVASETLANCESFLALEKYKLEDMGKKSFNFVEKTKFLNDNGEILYDCYKSLYLKFFSLKEISPLLKLTNVAAHVSIKELPEEYSSNEIKSVQMFLTSVYRESSKVFTVMGDELNDYDIYSEYERLKKPVKDFYGLLLKEEISFIKPSEKKMNFNSTLKESFLEEELISIEVLQRYFDLFKGIFPYLDLARTHASKHTFISLRPSDLFGPKTNPHENFLLRNSFDVILKEKIIPIIELAIAQQALLSGDVGLKIVYELLTKKNINLNKKTDSTKTIFNLFKYNPLFRNNFAKYYFIKRFNELKIKGKKNSALVSYTTAFILRDINYFKNDFSIHNLFKFEIVGKHRSIEMKLMEEYLIPLPFPDELLNGDYQHTTNMKKLIKMKAEAIGHLAEIELMRSQSEQRQGGLLSTLLERAL